MKNKQLKNIIKQIESDYQKEEYDYKKYDIQVKGTATITDGTVTKIKLLEIFDGNNGHNIAIIDHENGEIVKHPSYVYLWDAEQFLKSTAKFYGYKLVQKYYCAWELTHGKNSVECADYCRDSLMHNQIAYDRFFNISN